VTRRNEVLQSLFPDRDVSEIEGEFVPENQEPNQPDQEYRGEFRFVNLGPQKLRRLLANASIEDREAVALALQAWNRLQPSAIAEAGEPYRGEKREAIVATSMRDLVSRIAPVSHITAKNLSNRGIMPDDGEPHWLGIFDFDELAAGLPEVASIKEP
jgi:hypothetical protein